MINNIVLKEVEMIMARKLRTWFPGAFYHLMHRGVRRVAIFEDEMDYQMMLEPDDEPHSFIAGNQ